MDSPENQSGQQQDVNEILNNIPRSLYGYIIFSIAFSVLVFIFFLCCFDYTHTKKIDVVLQRTGMKQLINCAGLQYTDTEFIAKALVEQSYYAKIKDGAAIELQFTLYPAGNYGTLQGLVCKSGTDSILKNGLIELHLLLPSNQKPGKSRLITYQQGLEGVGIIRDSGSSFIKMIFNH